MKKKGQFFIMASLVSIFLMYLFTLGVINQEITESKDLETLEKVGEILYYIDHALKDIDLSSYNETYLHLLSIQSNIEKMIEIYRLGNSKIEMYYNYSSSKWEILLTIDTPYLKLEKKW